MRFSPEGSLDRDRCIRCGRCSAVCPSGAASGAAGVLPAFDLRRCISCGHCSAFCPVDAFHVGSLPGRPGGCGIDPLLELYSGRRSVRLFAPAEVTEADRTKMLSVVGYCPTGVNSCGIVVRAFAGGEARSLHEGARRVLRPLWKAGPLRLLGALAGQQAALRRFIEGEDLIFRQAPLVLFFFTPRRNPTSADDGVIAASMVMTAAGSMGFGSFWNGIARILYLVTPSWRRLAGVPRGSRLCAVLCLGRPAFESRPLPPRDWMLLDGGRPEGEGRPG